MNCVYYINAHSIDWKLDETKLVCKLYRQNAFTGFGYVIGSNRYAPKIRSVAKSSLVSAQTYVTCEVCVFSSRQRVESFQDMFISVLVYS